MISALAILHNRLGTTSINARLLVSSFALLCWVIPFSLVRNLFPQDASVALPWITPQSLGTFEFTTISQVAPSFSFSLFNIFILACLLGLVFSLVRLFVHFKWIKSLKSESQREPLKYFKGIPVYLSKNIKNALLIGYQKPSIWINQNLANSKHLKIILEHESTHKLYKDNYWLLLIELIRNIYWWNPLLWFLATDLTELLEARCDHKASQSFSTNSYQQQLASLMLNTQVDNHTHFSSAVVSKNPDVRRLQYLSEKPRMNFLSKISISFLTLLTVGLLSVPVSSFSVKIDNAKSRDQAIERFSLNFQMMPMAVATIIISEYYKVTEVVVDPSLTSVIFENFKVVKINLADLSDLTNITWEIKNNSLVVSPRKGAVISKIMSDEEYNEEKNNENELGALLEFELEHITMKEGVQHTWRKNTSIWSNFNKPFNMNLDNNREMEIIVTDLDDRILISSNIYTTNDDGSKVLIMSPKVLTLYESRATIRIGDDGNSEKDAWIMTIDPTKIKNPNLTP